MKARIIEVVSLGVLISGCDINVNNPEVNAQLPQTVIVYKDAPDPAPSPSPSPLPSPSPKKAEAIAPAPQPSPSPAPVPHPQARNGGIPIASYQGVDDRRDYPASAAVDGDSRTFWTTYTLILGQTKYLNFELQDPSDVTEIDFTTLPMENPCLGDFTFTYSQDSTNGTDGSWTPIALVDYDYFPGSGQGRIQTTIPNAKWIKLSMTYRGYGAMGSTPSFYLNEIVFH